MRARIVAATLLVTLAACGSSGATVSSPAPSSRAELPAEVVDTTSAPTSTAVVTTVAETVATTLEATTTLATAVTTTLPPTTAEAPPAPAPPPSEERPAAPGRAIGRILIPKLGIDAPLNQGVDLTTLDLGPGHWPGSALPGQVGNVVVAGHRVSHTRPFRYIDRLQPGDQVVFEIGGQQYTYAMTGEEIVTPDRIDIVNPTPTPTATLFACHPPGSTQFRYVVRLALVP